MLQEICIICLATKIITLPYDLICHTTHFILASDKLLHNCDIKAMIYYFLNMVVTSRLRSIILSYVHGEGILFSSTFKR